MRLSGIERTDLPYQTFNDRLKFSTKMTIVIRTTKSPHTLFGSRERQTVPPRGKRDTRRTTLVSRVNVGSLSGEEDRRRLVVLRSTGAHPPDAISPGSDLICAFDMTSTHHDDEEIEENEFGKSVEFDAASHPVGDDDGYDDGEGGDGNEGGEDEVPSSSRMESERTNESDRTNSTSTTIFSASSLPSLEGIDLVAATRASYSSLPPNDDNADDEHTIEPSTVITEDRNYAHESSAYLSAADPEPSTTTAKPLPASPRLPTAAYGNQHVRQSNTTSPPPSVPFWKRRAAVAASSSASASSTSTGEPLRKRVRRVGLRVMEHNHTTTMPEDPSVAVTETVSLESSHPAQDTTSCASTSIPANLQHQSKHDEKWFDMFAQLKEHVLRNGDTLVPQMFPQNLRLGRWVHYQRGECASRVVLK